MINVTKPFLPPISEYENYIGGIWKRNWLTNQGPLVNDLELKLKSYLNLEHLLFVNNGTTAIQLAIKAFGLTGEIITTPFSYVATTSSIVWEGCEPVFVDIDFETFNIDPKKIEEKITKNTSAILATHVFGNPCAIDEIITIAKKHNLKLIFDAAHCFGTKFKGKSVAEFGDVSTFSFHATKLFHTVEGGAVIANDPQVLRKIALLMNFGHSAPAEFEGVGINGKNSELHAAMGLCNLKYATEILEKRKEQFLIYNALLSQANITQQKIEPNTEYNHSYYPIVFSNEEELQKIIDQLNQAYVFPRRYFYPTLTTLDYVKTAHCPNSTNLSSRILCLPMYHDLSKEEQEMIARIILRTLRYK